MNFRQKIESKYTMQIYQQLSNKKKQSKNKRNAAKSAKRFLNRD